MKIGNIYLNLRCSTPPHEGGDVLLPFTNVATNVKVDYKRPLYINSREKRFNKVQRSFVYLTLAKQV